MEKLAANHRTYTVSIAQARAVPRRALTYYLHDESAQLRFQLAGTLTLGAAADLEQARQTAYSVLSGRSLIVDLTGVDDIDTGGRQFLDQWHALGARFVVSSAKSKARIQAMTRVPVMYRRATSANGGWLPSRIAALWLAASLAVLFAGAIAHGIPQSWYVFLLVLWV